MHLTRFQTCATKYAFAVILDDGSVVTWGNRAAGGDSSAVQHQLKDVQQIHVTWGQATDGGDSRAVQHQLKNVQQFQASSSAFAAILADGFVVTWGLGHKGGDSRAVQDQLKNVQKIQASSEAFAGEAVSRGVTVVLCNIS